MVDSVRNYIDSALHIMQARSLYSKSINWRKIKDSTLYKATNAHTFTEAFPALVYAFSQLKDKHGTLAMEDTFYKYKPAVPLPDRNSEGIRKEYLKGQRFVTYVLPGNVAYLRIPAMITNKQDVIDQLANRLRDSLCMLLAQNPSSLIIDLRMNNGGNAAPMLSGISLLLNEKIGSYVDGSGKTTGSLQLQNGILLDQDSHKPLVTAIRNTCSLPAGIKIAVLIGPSTASSGEITAAALKQQKNTRLFGEPTSGYFNATQGFLFMNNQGYLLLSVNWFKDNKGHVYKEEVIQPDVYIKSNDNYHELMADPTVQSALLWLAKK